MKRIVLTVIISLAVYSFVCGQNLREKQIAAVNELNSIPNEKEKLSAFNNEMKLFSVREKGIRKRIKECRVKKQKDSINYLFRLLNQGTNSSYKFSRKFIEENKNTLVGAYVFSNCLGEFHTEQIFSESEIFSLYKDYKKIKKGKIKNLLLYKINILKALQPKEKAPLINLQDTTRNVIPLVSFKGKYLIIDFWASWCCGCRQESPNLARIYNEFKSKGLEILGVSFDRKKDQWIKAIEEDNLSWTQVCDFSGMRGSVGSTYNLAYIPQLYILDRKGKIVCKGLRGEQLYNKIKELLDN